MKLNSKIISNTITSGFSGVSLRGIQHLWPPPSWYYSFSYLRGSTTTSFHFLPLFLHPLSVLLASFSLSLNVRICQGQIFNYLFSLPQSSQPSAIHTSNHIQYLQSPVGNFYLYFYLYLVRLKVSNHLAFLFFANNTILPDLTSLNLPFLFPPPKANVHQVLCYSPTSSPLHHPWPGSSSPPHTWTAAIFCTRPWSVSLEYCLHHTSPTFTRLLSSSLPGA